DLELALDGGVAAEGGGAGGGARRPRQVLQLLEHLDVHEEAAVVGGVDQGDGAGGGGLGPGQAARGGGGGGRAPAARPAGGGARREGVDAAVVAAGVVDLEVVAQHVVALLEDDAVVLSALGDVDGVGAGGGAADPGGVIDHRPAHAAAAGQGQHTAPGHPKR